jgi:hypothetical protein
MNINFKCRDDITIVLITWTIVLRILIVFENLLNTMIMCHEIMNSPYNCIALNMNILQLHISYWMEINSMSMDIYATSIIINENSIYQYNNNVPALHPPWTCVRGGGSCTWAPRPTERPLRAARPRPRTGPRCEKSVRRLIYLYERRVLDLGPAPDAKNPWGDANIINLLL